jgi:hypothetical protein
MGFFSNGDTYKRTLTRTDDAGTEEKLEVELRPLMAGDRADLQDQLRILLDDGDEAAEGNVLSLRPGTNRILTVAAAIVAWNLPLSPSVSSVRALQPDVLDWLFGEISWGSIPERPSQEEIKGDPLPERSASPEPVEHANVD